MDWEAILARSPEPFIQSVSPWLYPPAAREAPLQNCPSGQGLTADSARTEDPLADMSTPSVDSTGNGNGNGSGKGSGTANGSIAGSSKAAPPTTGLLMQPLLLAVACTGFAQHSSACLGCAGPLFSSSSTRRLYDQAMPPALSYGLLMLDEDNKGAAQTQAGMSCWHASMSMTPAKGVATHVSHNRLCG